MGTLNPTQSLTHSRLLSVTVVCDLKVHWVRVTLTFDSCPKWDISYVC